MAKRLQVGDWIGTEGRAGWRFWLSPVYSEIRAYSRDRYPPTVANPRPETDRTHVYLYVGEGLVFEVTYPRARVTSMKVRHLAAKFERGLVKVARFPAGSFNPDHCRAHALQLGQAGHRYDLGDLLDFKLRRFLSNRGIRRFFAVPIRVFGDRRRERFVCSSGAASCLSVAGYDFGQPIGTIDPNWPFNRRGESADPVDVTDRLRKESFE